MCRTVASERLRRIHLAARSHGGRFRRGETVGDGARGAADVLAPVKDQRAAAPLPNTAPSPAPCSRQLKTRGSMCRIITFDSPESSRALAKHGALARPLPRRVL